MGLLCRRARESRLTAPLASEPKRSRTLSMLIGRTRHTLTRATGKNCGSPPCFPPICPLLSLEASQGSGCLRATAPFHCEAKQGQEKARFCPWPEPGPLTAGPKSSSQGEVASVQNMRTQGWYCCQVPTWPSPTHRLSWAQECPAGGRSGFPMPATLTTQELSSTGYRPRIFSPCYLKEKQFLGFTTCHLDQSSLILILRVFKTQRRKGLV